MLDDGSVAVANEKESTRDFWPRMLAYNLSLGRSDGRNWPARSELASVVLRLTLRAAGSSLCEQEKEAQVSEMGSEMRNKLTCSRLVVRLSLSLLLELNLSTC